MTSLNRRQFLQFSAAAAAAGVITACGGEAPVPAPTTASGGSTPAAGNPTAAPKPTAAAANAPVPTAPPLNVSQVQATPAPTTAAATTPAQYKEAPQIAELVKSGKLPPAAMRMPEKPMVIKPIESTGVYGGVWHRAYKGLSDRVGPTKLIEESAMRWDAPDPNTIRVIPNFVEKWDQNGDASEYTFYIRKGLKWSDGTDVTTDDTKFWFDDVIMNKDIVPTPAYFARQRINGEYKNAVLTVVDKTTFKMKYVAPYPLLPLLICKSQGQGVGSYPFIAPSTYLKKFHPKYASMDELNKAAADKKVKTWQDLWGTAGNMEGPIAFWFLNPDLPVISAWKTTAAIPADPVVMERNPYFWKVDPDGNQLPYIDRVEHLFYDGNNDTLNLRIASGQIDLQYRNVQLGSYTFLKENEKKGNYVVKRWRSAQTFTFFPNLNAPDPVLAKLFDMADFRQALNISINRQEIADLVYNGLAAPRQASPVKGSPEYDADLEKMWTQYDPKAANDLLDKLGLMKGADGMRKRPDGQPLQWAVEHTDAPGSPDDDMNQRVAKYWNAVGLKVDMKFVERSLYQQHVYDSDLAMGKWGFDRCSVVKADAGRWIATIEDGPWAPAYGHVYSQSSYKKIEPPMDHPIRQMWDLWDKCQVEPDEAKRNALFQQVLGIHKQHPYTVGVVGQPVQPVIVSNSFHNFPDGYIADDTTRDYGLVNPPQFYIKK